MASPEYDQAQSKQILPFLQRADEIAKMEPKVAYYCRMYAVDTAIGFKHRGPKMDGLLRALIAKLEKDKPGAGLGDNDSNYCRTFAEGIFARADRVDRAGRADKNTSITFYAASIFIEILRQFGELPEDLVDVQKYAAWKAADISKALREGRQPTPGNGNAEPGDLQLPGVPTREGAAPQQSAERGLGSLDINDLPGPPKSGSQHYPSAPSSRSAYDSAPPLPQQQPPRQQDGGYGSPALQGGAASQPSWGRSHEQPPSPSPPPELPSPPRHRPSSEYVAQPPPPSLHQPPPPSGTSFGAASDRSYSNGGSGGGAPDQSYSSGGGGGLPSAPSFTRSVSVASSSDQQPAGHALAPCYPPGTRVLYDAFDEPAPVRGTVAKVDWQDDKWLYTVALPKQIVRVFEHILAPEYREGEAVLLRDPDGAATSATVVATDASVWRPRYTIRLASGQQLDASDDQLSPAQAQPVAPTAPQPQQPAARAPSARPPPRQQLPPSAPPGSFTAYSAPSPQPGYPASPPPQQQTKSQARHQPAAAPLPPSQVFTAAAPGFTPSLAAVTEAQKCAKYAASSLGFEDVAGATTYLQDALRLLTQP